MSTVQQAIEVSAPLHTVYERFASFESYPQFMTGVQEITPVSTTTAHWVMDIDGQRREFDAQITECRTDERVAWRATDGPTLEEVIMLRPVDGNRTHIIAQLEADVRGLMPSDAQAQESLNKRLKADLASFKRYIERDTAASPASMPGAKSGQSTRRGATGGAQLGIGDDAAIGSAIVGGPGNGNPRASSARAGNARTAGNAADLDLDAQRLTGLDDLDEQRGTAGGR